MEQGNYKVNLVFGQAFIGRDGRISYAPGWHFPIEGLEPGYLRKQIMDMRLKDLLSRLVANVLLLVLLALLGFGGWLVSLWARFHDKRT